MTINKYFFIFLILLLAKIMAAMFLHQAGIDSFGGGSDADYYDQYARGYLDFSTSSWPIILRSLNAASLYSRYGIAYALILLALIVIPLLVANLCKLKGTSLKWAYWAAASIVAVYPTIFYYSLDIYRESFMVFLWLCGLFVFKGLSEHPSLVKRVFLIVLGIVFSIILYSLRPYLGFAYFFALIFAGIYSFRNWSICLSLLFIASILLAFKSMGFLEAILRYRHSFDEHGAGSTLGIQFDSVVTFLPDFLLSSLSQLFGLSFPNMAAIALFFIESVPFAIFLTYAIKNRFYSNKFIDYLMVFSVVYALVWIVGNDNLGTAVRLRIFNYLSMLITFFAIYQNKRLSRSPR